MGTWGYTELARCRARGHDLYIADPHNRRVVKWAPGATQGLLVAGLGAPVRRLQMNTSGLQWQQQQQHLHNASMSTIKNKEEVLALEVRAIIAAQSFWAGTGVAGQSLGQLNKPAGIYLREVF
jgi:hypothetical protein